MAKSVRIPLAELLTNRDSTASKDSKLTNCFKQNIGGQPAVVKRPGTLSYVNRTTGQGQGVYCYNGFWSVSGNTAAQTVTIYGSNWTNNVAAFSARYFHTSASFNSKLWVLGGAGGAGNLNDVWSSPDGLTWTQVTSAAGWGIRQQAGTVVLNNKLWILGGVDSAYYNDVWSSPDGVTWTQVTSAAPWAARAKFGCIVFAGKMWVLGGSNTGGFYNDVWSSPDGVTWTQVTSAAPWAAREYISTFTFNGLLFITGGSANNGYYNDVWSSPDGVTWTQVTSAAPWAARRTSVNVYKNRVYLIAGTNLNPFNDVWSSADGLNWLQTNQISGFTARYGHTVESLNNTIFIIAGKTTGLTSDVWNSSGLIGQLASNTFPLTSDSLMYNFSTVGGTSSPLLVLKNNNQMYTFNVNTGVLSKVTSANYPATTIPGLVYLDGTFYVATADSKIYGSAIEDPTTWSALNYTSAQIEPDGLVAIEKSLNYLVAFGQWTTEFFYDAGNATGSPLSSVPNAFFTVGCASGTSVVRMENMVVWMSQTIQRGRQVMVLNGFTPSIISTAEVDRILNADDLATIYSFSIKISGSVFYVLTLKTSAKTLVYDFSNKEWHFWTSMVPQTAKSITTITSTNGIATVSQTAHGYADGDLITIAGATPTAYNGSFNVTYVDANTYTYPVPLGTISPATGTITALGYTETYFNAVAYSFCSGSDLIQGETDGKIYKIDPSYYDDNGNYINTKIKTVRIDGGESKRKFVSKAEIIGDKVSATGLLRYTDDDYVTYSVYRPIDMNAKRSMLLRQGHTRRRAYEYRCTASVPLRLGALELDMEMGTS